MFTVFIEYKIDPDKRQEFLREEANWERNVLMQGGRNFRFYEGVDQPNLFVEEFDVNTLEEYHSFKEQRRSNEQFLSFVAGGAAKVHIWAFRVVRG